MVVPAVLSVVTLGFALGMRHATDPDHVVAVATIVSRERSLRAAAPIGLLWGVGHTITLVVLGIAIIAFGVVIPPRLGLGMEFCVSVMLVVLGAWNLAAIVRKAEHRHGRGHDHDGLERLDRIAAGWRGTTLLRPLVVGVVHGLAGSAAVALLVLGTIRDVRWAALYLVVFGGGTVAGMLVVTTALALPLALSAARFRRVHRSLGVGCASLSALFGAFLMYDTAIVHGLFAAGPQWTPG